MTRMQVPKDRILLRVSVEIAENHNDEILVFERDVEESDGPSLLATEFCRKHNLDPKKVHAPLKDHILNNIRGIITGTNRTKNSNKKPSPKLSSRRVFTQRLKSAPRANLNPALANGTSCPSRVTGAPKKRVSGSTSLTDPLVSQRASCKKAFAPLPRNSHQPAAAASKAHFANIPIRGTRTPTPTPRTSISRPSSAPRVSSTMTPRPSSTATDHAAAPVDGVTVTKAAHEFTQASTSTSSVTQSVEQRASRSEHVKRKKILTDQNSARALLRTRSGPESTGTQSARGIRSTEIGNQEAKVRSGSQSARSMPRVRAASVFDKLYADAAVKSVKLETMRASFLASWEKSQEGVGASQTTLKTKPGSRSLSSDPGHRLYSEAQRRKEKFDALREKQTQILARKEMEEVTLRPQIHESQRRVLGLPSRLCADDVLKKRSAIKMERLRQESEEKMMKGCTFQPEIDERSHALMEKRLSRLKITGSLHDHLYDDAKRREWRYTEYYNRRESEATFCPDIGLDHFRPPNDDTDQDFVNRLAYSRAGTTRKSDRSASHAAESDFHPKTGRPPNSARNADGLPIGEFLYNAGRARSERREQKQHDAHAQEERRKEHSMSSTSKHKFDGAKQRKFEAMFKILSNGGSEITAEHMSLEGLDPETAEFVEPVLQFVKRENSKLNFEDFCVAMDYAIENSVTPIGHLFVDHARRVPIEEPTFTPRVSKKSGELAKNRRRDVSVPLYDQLCAENDAYEASRQKKMQEKADDVLKECTFQPNTGRRNSYDRSSHRVNAASGPLKADGSHARSDPNLRTSARGAYGYRAQVDAAEAAVRRCRDVVEKAKHAVEGMYG